MRRQVNASSNNEQPSKPPRKEYRQFTRSNKGKFEDAQFDLPPKPIPWNSIMLAMFLLTTGTVLLIVGGMLFSGHIANEYSDRMWPLFILGSLMFIPGFYHIRLAFFAYKGYSGYNFHDFPSFYD